MGVVSFWATWSALVGLFRFISVQTWHRLEPNRPPVGYFSVNFGSFRFGPGTVWNQNDAEMGSTPEPVLGSAPSRGFFLGVWVTDLWDATECCQGGDTSPPAFCVQLLSHGGPAQLQMSHHIVITWCSRYSWTSTQPSVPHCTW